MCGLYQLDHPGLPDLVVPETDAPHVRVLLDRLSQLDGARIPDLVLPEVQVADAQLGHVDLLGEAEAQLPLEVVPHLELRRNDLGQGPAMRVRQVVLLQVQVLQGGAEGETVGQLLEAVGGDVSLIDQKLFQGFGFSNTLSHNNEGLS